MDYYLEFLHEELTPELIEYARINLNETEENKVHGLQELRRLCNDNEDIEFIDDENLLLVLLRCKKFNPQKALEHANTCYKHLNSHKKLFFRDNFGTLEKVLKANFFGFLQHRDPMGRAIVYANLRNWNMDEISTLDVVFGGLVTIMSSIYNPVNQVAGYVTILNFEHLQLKHIVALLRWAVVLIISLQKVCPGFLKAFHIIYTSPIYKIPWEAIKPFLSKKMKKRYLFHKLSNISTLYEYVPQAVLPEELGGAVPFSNTHWTADIDCIVTKYKELITKNYYKSKKIQL